LASDKIEASVLENSRAHQLKLDTYCDEELIKINKMINQVQREILHGWDKMTDFSKSRAITLLDDSRAITAGVKEAVTGSIAKKLGEVSAESAAVHSKILSFDGKAANVQMTVLSAEKMTSFWKNTPVGGSLLKDWVDRTFDGPAIEKIQREIATGMFKGESYRQLGNRLKDGYGATRREIDTLVRTYVQSANSDAIIRTYRENKDLIKGVKWSAAKIKSTCLICISLDGKKWPVEEAPIPPIHPRCRCQLIPDTSFALLGLKGEDGAKLSGMLQRDREDAKDWLLRQPEADRKHVMGPKRFDLLEKGLVKFDDLVGMSDFHIRTLKELAGDVDLTVASRMGSAEATAILDSKARTKELIESMAYEKEMALRKKMLDEAAVPEVPVKSLADIEAEKVAKKKAYAAEYYVKWKAGEVAKKAAEKALAEATLAAKKSSNEYVRVRAAQDLAKDAQRKERVAKAEYNKAVKLEKEAEAAAKKKAKGEAIAAGMARAKAKKLADAAALASKPVVKGGINEALIKESKLMGDDFVLYDSQKGSNEGAFYHRKGNPDEKYYFKFPKSEVHIDNEILASKMYRAAGVKVPELMEVELGGRRGVASRIMEGLAENRSAITSGKYAASIEESMAVDAWLANWDVVGTGYNNLLMQGGEAVRIDVGGSLLFRAQGGAKGHLFGADVGELRSFLDKYRNPCSAEVFGRVTKEQIEAGIRKVAALSDSDIRLIVDRHGPSSIGVRDEIYQTLVARKEWLLREYPDAAYPPGLTPKPVKAKVTRASGEVAFTENNKNAWGYMDGVGAKHMKKANKDPELKSMVEKVMAEAKIGIRATFGSERPATVTGITDKGRLLNQFQMGSKASSGGSLAPYKGGGRDGWEENITDKAYHARGDYQKLSSRDYFDGTEMAEERPTYGFLYRDGHETSSASGYGNVVFTFGDDIKKRSTMTYANSSGVSASQAASGEGEIGSFSNPAPVAKNIAGRGYATTDIDKAWRAVEYNGYTEIQVHTLGGVEVGRATSVIIDRNTALHQFCKNKDNPMSKEKNLKLIIEQVKTLSEKYQIPWGFMGEELQGIAGAL